MLVNKGDIAIRKLKNDEYDFSLILKWLTNEKVTEFCWNEDLPWTYEKVRADFSTDESDTTAENIVLYKNAEVGYIQYYPIERDSYKFNTEEEYETFKGAYGFDMFIGVPSLWGKGIGKAAALLLISYLNREKGATKFAVDPSLNNESSTKFWQKIGFEPITEVEGYDNPTDKSMLMLKIL